MRSMKRRDTERGFSLIELLVTVVIIVVVFAMAVFQLMPALRSAHMDTASAVVQTQLRAARARAIGDRGEVIVTFDSTGTIATSAPNITGFVPVTVPLPSDVAVLPLLAGCRIPLTTLSLQLMPSISIRVEQQAIL